MLKTGAGTNGTGLGQGRSSEVHQAKNAGLGKGRSSKVDQTKNAGSTGWTTNKTGGSRCSGRPTASAYVF